MSKKKHRRHNRIDHSQCECKVQQRGPHWGLFCVPHNAYIKWLNPQEQTLLRQIDIPWIYQTPDTQKSAI
jgi:hypothetical protein